MCPVQIFPLQGADPGFSQRGVGVGGGGTPQVQTTPCSPFCHLPLQPHVHTTLCCEQSVSKCGLLLPAPAPCRLSGQQGRSRKWSLTMAAACVPEHKGIWSLGPSNPRPSVHPSVNQRCRCCCCCCCFCCCCCCCCCCRRLRANFLDRCASERVRGGTNQNWQFSWPTLNSYSNCGLTQDLHPCKTCPAPETAPGPSPPLDLPPLDLPPLDLPPLDLPLFNHFYM